MIQNRLQIMGWFSLAVLVATGMVQMSASPRYDGFLAITNRWAAAILLKHLVFGLMILICAAQRFWLRPGLQRAKLMRAVGRDPEAKEEARLRRIDRLLLRANLLVGVVILIFTAIARIS